MNGARALSLHDWLDSFILEDGLHLVEGSLCSAISFASKSKLKLALRLAIFNITFGGERFSQGRKLDLNRRQIRLP